MLGFCEIFLKLLQALYNCASNIKVLVGVPQGSGWSPELATLYVDFGLAENLQTIRSGIVV